MPVTLPLYAAGGVYETFQTSIGIGTPPQYFNLTLVSTALNDFALSANITLDDGPCSMPLLDRSEYFKHK
ncbi:hypothetical protein AAVH_25260 [Aphelenchoides avenae]|nr:hypothetical protein AAVH_25260 [Aphelenchus avenae]